VLSEAVATWLDGVTERELDAPLRALLLARGYERVEFVHGSSEFGRDLIGQRDGDEGRRYQWNIQAKAGDINKARWQEIRGQLEDIRTIPLRHPSVDPELPTVAVVVTSGRLVGDARAAAGEYVAKYKDEMPVEMWTRDRLLEYLVAAPDAVFAGAATGPLLATLGAIESGTLDDRALERYSRSWLPEPGAGVSAIAQIEAAMLASRLARHARLDLACLSALCLLRAALVAAHGSDAIDPEVARTINTAGHEFAAYAEQLWERCIQDTLDPVLVVREHSPEVGIFATYNVRCVRVIEMIGLLGLWRQKLNTDTTAIITWLADFIDRQPGAARPLSDRWASSLIPPALLLGREQQQLVGQWLSQTARWVGDRLADDGLGLAGVDADPREEIDYLLGDLEHVTHRRRRESRVAAVVLDLASALELGDLYDFARHEFEAVGAVGDVLHTSDTVDQYLADSDELERELNPLYTPSWAERDGWITAPHQRDTSHAPSIAHAGLIWEHIAVWTVLRDRHLASLMRQLVSS